MGKVRSRLSLRGGISTPDSPSRRLSGIYLFIYLLFNYFLLVDFDEADDDFCSFFLVLISSPQAERNLLQMLKQMMRNI